MNKDQLVALLTGIAKVIGAALATHGLANAATLVTTPDVIESAAGVVMAIVSFYASHSYNAAPGSAASGPSGSAGGAVKAIIGALLISGMMLGTGCKSTSVNLGVTTATTDTNGVLTVGGTVVQPAAAGVAVQLGAKYGAQALLQRDPSSRQYLAIAAGVIDAAVANQTYDPAALQTNLETALKTATNTNTAGVISSAIGDGLDLYTIFYAQVTGQQIANVSPYLRPALVGLSAGIQQALGSIPVPTP